MGGERTSGLTPSNVCFALPSSSPGRSACNRKRMSAFGGKRKFSLKLGAPQIGLSERGCSGPLSHELRTYRGHLQQARERERLFPSVSGNVRRLDRITLTVAAT